MGRRISSGGPDVAEPCQTCVKTVVVLLGPTGIGKTKVSLLLAQRLGTEIISADSMQIYRGMDIGTAKPTPEERSTVRHHMIDIVESWQQYSAGDYISAVVPVINMLQERGKVPLVVGGTGLYIRAMTRGIFSGPSADWELRSELLETERISPGSLYGRLRLLDKEASERIFPTDTRRVLRALEVCLKTEGTISQLHRERTQPLPYRFIKIGLTRRREELYRDIDARVDVMVAGGLVEEVKAVSALIERHSGEDPAASSAGRTPPLPSMQAIGYKEIALYLSGRTTLEEATLLIKKRSRNYAKRQFTWFRKEPDISWVDITGLPEPEAIVENMLTILEKA